MADLPKIKSKEQYVGELTDAFLARANQVNDLTRQSVLFQFFEATGQSLFRSSAAILQMIDAQSIDRAVGEALQTIARDKNVPILSASPSSGRVSITDTSFQKIETRVYAGQPAPVAGSTVIHAANLSAADPDGGELYIGRRSGNSEGPLTYTSITQESGGAFWKIELSTNTPTTKFHNTGERITIAQGGQRPVPVNTIVKTKSGAVGSVDFRTTKEAFILDGETTVSDVPVIATQPGTRGNVFRGAISEVTSLPFSAVAFNNNPLINGRDADDNDTLRARIKRFEQAKARGTDLAIIAASIGAVSEDDKEKVQSADVVSFADNSAALIFDNGSDYESIINGIGVEQIVEEAVGGELELQLRQRPIVPAQTKNNIDAPYNIQDNQQLSVTIEGETRVHTFSSDDFSVLGNATAAEVAASINGNPNIHFNASSTDGNTRLFVTPRDRDRNDIQVNTLDLFNANDALGFGTSVEFTARIYKNDIALFESGRLATISTRAKSTWTTVASGDTLSYKVDGTPEITASFSQLDFQDVDPTANFSELEDIAIWAQVFNNKMPGVTASVQGNSISFTSNLGEDDRASLEFTGGQLLGKIFNLSTLASAIGRESDYTLNRQTGQLSLNKEPLNEGDKLTAGSPITSGNILTSSIPAGTGSSGNVWMLIDGEVLTVENGLRPSTRITFEKLSNGKLEITAVDSASNPEGFESVQEGDWFLIYHNEDDVGSDPNEAKLKEYSRYWRVEEVDVGFIRVDDSFNTSVSVGTDGPHTLPTDRFVFARSSAPLQKLSFTPLSLNDFINAVRDQIEGVKVELVGSQVRISTASLDENEGEIYTMAADDNGRSLGLIEQTAFRSIPSHRGFASIVGSEAGMPSFTHDSVDSISSDIANFDSPNLEELNGDIGDWVEILNSYDEATFDELTNSNKDRRAYIEDFEDATSGQDVDLLLPEYLQSNTSPIRSGDRVFLRQPFMFDDTDRLSVVVDGDTTTKSYALKVARKLEVGSHTGPTPNSHTSTQNSFSAIDSESNLELENVSSFGPSFSFNNFKAWRQAHNTLTDGNYEIDFKSADFGPAGDLVRIGFEYPQTTDQTEIAHSISSDEGVEINIQIPISESRAPNWDSTSSFTVNVLSTSGGKDTIKYTWRVGTEPDFVTAGVLPGDLALLSNSSDLLNENKGFQAKVTNITANSFTVERPTSTAKTDEVQISNMINDGTLITVTTAIPHEVSTGDRVGLYDTASSDGGTTFPFEQTYFATVVNSTVFTVNTPSSIPGDDINSMDLNNYLVTVSATAHGLFEENVIIIQGAGAPYDGLATVHEVIDSNTFSFLRNTQNASTVTVGEFNFQSYTDDPASLVNISSLSQSGFEVTVTTSSAHGFTVGNIVRLQNVDIEDWSSTENYSVLDIVEHEGLFYRALQDSQAFSSDGVSTNINSEDQSPLGLAFNNDGSKMYMSGTFSDRVYQYSLSTPFDVSTAVYDSISLDVSLEGISAPSSITFNGNGSRLFVLGRSTNAVYQYNLSSPYNLSTATFSLNSFSTSTETTSAEGLEFNNSGTKMYVVDAPASIVYEYTLSSAFDLGSVIALNFSFSVSAQASNPTGIAINSDGSKMYISGSINDAVYQYTLTTPFDLSTANYDSVFLDVSSEDSAPQDLALNNDDTKLYMLGSSSDSIHQYSIGNEPDESPAFWEQIDYDINKNYIIDSVTSNTFTFFFDIQGNTDTDNGQAIQQTISGALARSLADEDFLQFGVPSTTSQEIVDYVNVNMSDFISASLGGSTTGSEPVVSSTEDNDASTGYLDGTITQIKTLNGQRKIKLRSTEELQRGSRIEVSGFTNSQYDGSYLIEDLEEVSTGVFDYTVQSDVFSYTTQELSDSGTFTGTTPHLFMDDGENYIKTTDLDASGSSPMFTTKRSWSSAPETGEEIILIPETSEQVNSVWNKLIFTGLSNVANISNNNFGTGLQISTKTFGSSGSIRIVGGDANSKSNALIGSAIEFDEKVGILRVPYDLRSGLIPNQWLKLENQLRLPKNVGFDSTTVLTADNSNNTLEIVGGPGNFQVIRTDSVNDEMPDTTKIKIERQGDFVAIIAIDGTFNLSQRDAQEGDWIRIDTPDLNSVTNPTYSELDDYTTGNTVTFGNKVWIALQANGISSTVVEPGTDITVWEPYSVDTVNSGIFQIVRVYGDDTIYIKNDNAIEEITQIGPSTSYIGGVGIIIYSYDSVMPGDQLVLSGDVLGVSNIGRFTVSSDSFPTSTKVTLEEPVTDATSVTLGTKRGLIRIEEENPLVLWKRIKTIGPGSNDLANIIVDSPNLINRMSSSAGTSVTALGKLNFSTGVFFGLDAYKHYGGLHKQLNKIVYGDPKNKISFAGVRAAGTDIDIRKSIIKRIKLAVAVRARTGVPFDEIRERVRAAIAGSINRLGVGEQVSLSNVIAAASTINGVYSIVITDPVFDAANDLIPVGSQEKAFVVNPAQDIVISILGT